MFLIESTTVYESALLALASAFGSKDEEEPDELTAVRDVRQLENTLAGLF